MKLKKRVKEYLDSQYNDHLESGLVDNKHLINGLLELVESYPDDFSFELSYRANAFRSVYQFKFKRIGYYPDFLKSIGA